jgi:hypothetical protein
MAADPKAGARFAGAFAEELGKWLARLVIAAVVAAMSGYLALPH